MMLVFYKNKSTKFISFVLILSMLMMTVNNRKSKDNNNEFIEAETTLLFFSVGGATFVGLYAWQCYSRPDLYQWTCAEVANKFVEVEFQQEEY